MDIVDSSNERIAKEWQSIAPSIERAIGAERAQIVRGLFACMFHAGVTFALERTTHTRVEHGPHVMTWEASPADAGEGGRFEPLDQTPEPDVCCVCDMPTKNACPKCGDHVCLKPACIDVHARIHEGEPEEGPGDVFGPDQCHACGTPYPDDEALICPFCAAPRSEHPAAVE